jgi:hypothetical protein
MTETKQWMGLHNHDRHFYSPGYGDRCGKCWYCSPETPCYCCLQAEVEALRAQVQRVREEVNGDQPIPRASDDLDNVAAYCAGYVDALRRVRRALDGADHDA